MDAPPGPLADTDAPTAVGGGAPRRRPWWREVWVLGAIALVLALVVRALLVQAFAIPSGSMEPTLSPGDRVLVARSAYRVGDVQRGDVVVFDGQDSFSGPPAEPVGTLARVLRGAGSVVGLRPSEHDFVKRVVGLPGDHVVCCGTDGRLTVNGTPLDEPYVHPGDTPSDVRFDVVVPAGRLWVMGDHRSDSADSRAHLGDPGGGTVPVDRLVGKVVLRFWPLDRAGTLPDPTTSAAVRSSGPSQGAVR